MENNTNLQGAADISARIQERLMICLAMIAGYSDSYGLLHFKTYVSFMSGNTTQTGFALGQQNFPSALIAFTAISFFCIAIVVATILSGRSWYQGRWMTFVAVGILLAICEVLVAYSHLNKYIGVALLSFAIGYLNNVLTHIGAQSVNPDFVTGNLNNSMKHVAQAIQGKPLADSKGTWDTHSRRAKQLLTVWFSFVAGACVCVLVAKQLGAWALSPVILILLLCPRYVRKRPIPLG